jgi:acetyl esterase/lipase
VNDYTKQTLAVTIFGGQRNVTYRLYRHIAYVANPVDVNYESLDVAVPVKINDKDINATNAPILLIVNNAGYMASSNTATGLGRIPNDANGRSALAAGYVVVCPGLRGWNLMANSTYYGKAPAAILDLKATVRYIRHNDYVMPGNGDWIIAYGISGGGAQSALLGVSGNSPLYDAALEEMGAANATDNIYASAPYYSNPDLDHADMAYEWEFGTTPIGGDLVNQTISQQLKDAFSVYQASLNLQGKNAYGNITAENYRDYLVETYLIPSANEYLTALTNEDRETYLSSHAWITWSNNSAAFSFEDYVAYIGRTWGLPAFDAFDLSAWGNTLFGNSTTNARHFTNFSLRYANGDPAAEIDGELQTTVDKMNSMYFIQMNNTDCVQYWFIRGSTKEVVTMFGNLATILENNGKDVNALLYWDEEHGINQDPEAFVLWVSEITGYPIAIPEFQAVVFLSILLMATLSAAILSKGKQISRSGCK